MKPLTKLLHLMWVGIMVIITLVGIFLLGYGIYWVWPLFIALPIHVMAISFIGGLFVLGCLITLGYLTWDILLYSGQNRE